MRPPGDKRLSTQVKGHQDCGTCHPDLKNRKKRERREGKKVAQEGLSLGHELAGSIDSDEDYDPLCCTHGVFLRSPCLECDPTLDVVTVEEAEAESRSNE